MKPEDAAVWTTLLKPPVLTGTGSWRACVEPVPRSGEMAVAGVDTEKLAGRASDPELGMVFRDYFEVDDDGQISTEAHRHDFGDVIPRSADNDP